jgi:excisionase family DNA binding protein
LEALGTLEKRQYMAQLLKINDVSDQLKMSKSSIRREIDRGNLQAVKIGKSVRISSEELNRYLSSLNEPQKV